MPDIQDAFQAALFIALLVTLALAALLAAVVAALRYWQPQQQPPPRRRSLYYPSTRSSVENAYRIASVPDRPVFRNVDWSYGTFQNRFEPGPARGGGGPRGFIVDDEQRSVSTRWGHASPFGRRQGGLHHRAGVEEEEEERKDAAGGLEATGDLADEGRECRDGEETSGSSTPLASNQGVGAASGWADGTRGGRGHSV
ncbi:unnamed protein product [Clonostachys solani]|uniref:Uncharacterized protein n=1 Tax=Clonostachys solani TaxID=160281 RepID=A0A9N9W3P3_9HYPO|nr:unnamed protein product [Clonostachys solani]